MPALLALALAQPAHALLPEPDLDMLAAASSAGLHPMADACVVVAGDTQRSSRVGVMKDTEHQTWTAKLDQGVWREFEMLENQDEDPNTTMTFGELPFVPPLLGSFDGQDQVIGLLGELTKLLEGPTVLSTPALGTHDGQEVYLLQRKLEPQGWFAAAEQEVTVQPDSRARRWHTKVRKARLETAIMMRRAEMVSEVDAQGMPTMDSIKGLVRLGPFGLHMDQTSTYAVVGTCEPGSSVPAPAAMEEAPPAMEEAPAEVAPGLPEGAIEL